MKKCVHIFADKKGATAVEFALIAGPFIWLLIGLVELALYFTTASLMAEAANVGARMIRTGQIEQNADPEQAFIDAVCDRAAVFIPCEDIQYQVTRVPNGQFQSADNFQPTMDDDGNLTGQGYEQGSESSVMIVRVGYRFPFLTPLIGGLLADGPRQTRLILNTIVMKSEPYDPNA